MDAQISISSSHTNAKVKRSPVGMKTVTIRSKKEEKKRMEESEWKQEKEMEETKKCEQVCSVAGLDKYKNCVKSLVETVQASQ